MDEGSPLNSLVGRSLAGACAGSVLGAAGQLLVYGNEPPLEGSKLPWQGALIGAALVGTIALLFGAKELPHWLRKVVLGLLTGVVVGVLGGAFVYAPIMTTLEVANDSVFRTKVEASYRIKGIRGGALLGSTGGLIVGIAVCLYDPRTRKPELYSASTDVSA